MKKELGLKIRNLRSAAELTQDELAQRAGLTDGFISQVERGRTSISIDSLKMILDALNVSLAEFFHEEKYQPVVFGPGEQMEIEQTGSEQMFLLVPGATNRLMEPARLELPPGKSTGVLSAFQGDIYGYIVSGRIIVQYGSENHKARTGESFYFSADHEFRIFNPYRRKAVVMWISSPPYF